MKRTLTLDITLNVILGVTLTLTLIAVIALTTAPHVHMRYVYDLRHVVVPV